MRDRSNAVVASEWPKRQLREFCQFAGGGKLKLTKGDYRNEGYPAFSAAGQDGFVDVAEFDVPGIAASSIGARCGKASLATRKWTTLANDSGQRTHSSEASAGWPIGGFPRWTVELRWDTQ